MAHTIEVTGPVFFVAPIDDGASDAALAITQYNVVNSTGAFTGEQKEVLNALIACSTGFRPAAHENPMTPGKDAEGNVPKGVTNGRERAKAKAATAEDDSESAAEAKAKAKAKTESDAKAKAANSAKPANTTNNPTGVTTNG